MMIRVIKTTAAIALLGQADAGLVIKAPRTESAGLPSGHVFFEPVPISMTISPTTSSTPTEIAHAPGATGFDADAPIAYAPNPETTSAPTLEVGLDGSQGQKFVQTTYWACATLAAETHCGWHEPILDASMESAGVRGGRVALRTVGIVAFFVAGGFFIL